MAFRYGTKQARQVDQGGSFFVLIISRDFEERWVLAYLEILCAARDLCDSVVSVCSNLFNHRATENAEPHREKLTGNAFLS